MQPKAKTLIEKLGFIDTDRKSPSHDEIQIWASSNIQNILSSLSREPDTQFYIEYLGMEHPIVQHSYINSVVGFIDLYAEGWYLSPSDNSNWKRLYVSIEIKSAVQSCGDLIRQINFYKQFEKHPNIWIVISPDDKFASVLAGQGIRFYKFANLASS